MDFETKIKQVADAQRLTLSDDEIRVFSKQLQDVLSAFDALDKIDTDHVQPAYHPIVLSPTLRPDEPKASTHPTENHQRQEKGYLRGPRMMR